MDIQCNSINTAEVYGKDYALGRSGTSYYIKITVWRISFNFAIVLWDTFWSSTR